MMTGLQPLVLVAAKDSGVAQTLNHHLREWECRVAAVDDAAAFTQAVAAEQPALVFFDPLLQHDGGAALVAARPGLPVVLLVLPGSAHEHDAALRDRVFDYLPWPPDLSRLRVILAHALERQRLLDRIRRLENPHAAASETEKEMREIDRLEKRAIIDALRRADGNVRVAARLLGLGQATIYRKVKRYGIVISRRRNLAIPEQPTPLTPTPVSLPA